MRGTTLFSMLTAAVFAMPMHTMGGEEKALRAGAAKSNITPRLGISLAGYMRDRNARHVHDELHVRCLVLDNGETQLAFAVCDLIALGKEPINRAKGWIREACGIPEENILVSSVHTHSAPTTVPVFQSDPDEPYVEWLARRIADGVIRAWNQREPAQAGWAVGNEDRAVFNRRFFLKPGTMPPNPWGETTDTVKMNPGVNNPNIVKPAGPIDPAFPVLAVKSADGHPIALLANYALHYVGGNPSDEVSADYFGMFARIVESKLDVSLERERPPFVAMLTNGCSGDINNIDVENPVNQPHPYHQMRAVARMVADEALRLWDSIEFHDWAELGAAVEPLTFKVRKAPRGQVEAARGTLAQAGTPLKSLMEIYARETVLLDAWPDEVETMAQALRVGGMGIAAFPGEAFVELGLEVKQKSPLQPAMCIELANDYAGYIPTEEAHAQGGYETWRARSSFLEPKAGPVLVQTLLDLLESLGE